MEIHQALTRSETIENILCRHEQVGTAAGMGRKGGASHTDRLWVSAGTWWWGMSWWAQAGGHSSRQVTATAAMVDWGQGGATQPHMVSFGCLMSCIGIAV